MIESILQAYNIPASQCQHEVLVSGLINQTWRITYGARQYILQRINDNIFKNPRALGDNVRMLQQYLTQHSPDYTFVAPLQTPTGDNLVHNDTHGYFRLFPYVEGSHTYNVVQTPEQAYEAAFQFGNFARKLGGFDAGRLHVTIPDFHNLDLRYQQLNQAAVDGNPQRIKQAAALIGDIRRRESIVDVFKIVRTNRQVKQREMHHDTKISNVLFDEHNKGICVIDLDTVMPGYFISDFGDMLRTYLSPASEEEEDLDKIEIRDDIFKAIVQGYAATMGDTLTEAERHLLLYAGSFLIFMQAIRFLADHLYNDVYYGARYEGHNLTRAANQLRLLKRLDEKQPGFQKIIDAEWPKGC